MGRQIVKQPNGQYAVFSSIVDDFVLVDATPEEIIEEYVANQRRSIEQDVREVIEKLESGQKPYYQFTRTFEECVQVIRDLHGTETESLKHFGLSGEANKQAAHTERGLLT